MVKPKQYKQSLMMTLYGLIGALVGALGVYVLAVISLSSEGISKWLGIAFTCASGLITVAFLSLVLRPMRLTLSPDGFTLSGGWSRSPRFVAWRDVDGPIECYPIGRGQSAIGYNLIKGGEHQGSRIKFFDYGYRARPDASLPNVWIGSGDEMADELNAYRTQVLGTEG